MFSSFTTLVAVSGALNEQRRKPGLNSAVPKRSQEQAESAGVSVDRMGQRNKMQSNRANGRDLAEPTEGQPVSQPLKEWTLAGPARIDATSVDPRLLEGCGNASGLQPGALACLA